MAWTGRNVTVWRGAVVGGFGAMLGIMWAIRNRGDLKRKRWQWAMFVAGLAAFLVFCFGGFVRESSRSPYTVYQDSATGEIGIMKPEALDFEKDRAVLYDKCLNCHVSNPHNTPRDFIGYDTKLWDARMEKHFKSKWITLTADQGMQIRRALKEPTP